MRNRSTLASISTATRCLWHALRANVREQRFHRALRDMVPRSEIEQSRFLGWWLRHCSREAARAKAGNATAIGPKRLRNMKRQRCRAGRRSPPPPHKVEWASASHGVGWLVGPQGKRSDSLARMRTRARTHARRDAIVASFPIHVLRTIHCDGSCSDSFTKTTHPSHYPPDYSPQSPPPHPAHHPQISNHSSSSFSSCSRSSSPSGAVAELSAPCCLQRGWARAALRAQARRW